MSNVILSIKPVCADQIFNGTKLLEFRKTVIKRLLVGDKCVVYSSGNVKKVIGEFTVKDIFMQGPLLFTLKHARETTGIDTSLPPYVNAILEYYTDKYDKSFIIHLENPVLYPEPLDILKAYNKNPPQSFCYI